VAVLALLLAGGAALASPSVRDQLGIAPQATAAPAPDTTQTNRNGKQHDKGAQLAGLLVRATADATGLQPKDVVQEVSGSKSLAQIAQEHGKTGDDILAKLREQGQQRLDKALDRAKGLLNQPGLRGSNQSPSSGTMNG